MRERRGRKKRKKKEGKKRKEKRRKLSYVMGKLITLLYKPLHNI